MPSPFATVDEYVESFPEPVRGALQAVRDRVRQTVPDAEERVSYGIAGFRLDGKMLLYVGGWAGHVSMHPIPEADADLAAEIDRYRAGKGTLKFPIGEPMPLDLVGRLAARFVDMRRG